MFLIGKLILLENAAALQQQNAVSKTQARNPSSIAIPGKLLFDRDLAVADRQNQI
jgi:hypothetical protein